MSNVLQPLKAVAHGLVQPPERGMIGSILSALHASRRQRARRIICEYARFIE
jgi:hypothetical protein